MSRQLRATLRLWRRHQSAVWLKKAKSRPAWVFASTAGTALDESNVRKAFNQILDKAELHRRGPHQMRHTFGSLLINVGEPVTYVSRQLGHKDSAITLGSTRAGCRTKRVVAGSIGWMRRNHPQPPRDIFVGRRRCELQPLGWRSAEPPHQRLVRSAER